jgi:hypothetical protein
MSAHRDSQRKMAVNESLRLVSEQIAPYQITTLISISLHFSLTPKHSHKNALVHDRPHHNPKHILRMRFIPFIPRLIPLIAHQPRAMIPLVERERDESPFGRPLRLALGASLVPSGYASRGDIGHALLVPQTLVVQPEAGDARGRGGYLVEAVDINDEAGHGHGAHGDGGAGREVRLCGGGHVR